MKQSKKVNKYLDLAREQKKLWNMRVMVIPIVIGTLRVPKGLDRRLEELKISGRFETVWTTMLLRLARILR